MARILVERGDAVPALTEVFREHGFDGASLSLISQASGLGKGSLYHFFPGGKEEMAGVVLADIDKWFEDNIFRPLRADDPTSAIRLMIENVADYFRSGRRACLVGAFALNDTRDRFAVSIRDYFTRWIDSLFRALVRAGMEEKVAALRAEDAVLSIQGALVLSRALNSEGVFARALERISADLEFPTIEKRTVSAPKARKANP
jgi:TetR/AcrR family transcriptional regulator, lmrAB and yxaGH operons repressor